MLEYSLAAGVRAKVDRFRLRLGGWKDQDLDEMLATSRGPREDEDVRAERLRVDRAMSSRGDTRAMPEDGVREMKAENESETGDAIDTVLIRGLTKVRDVGAFLFLCLFKCFSVSRLRERL